jgi:hypothetical protein
MLNNNEHVAFSPLLMAPPYFHVLVPIVLFVLLNLLADSIASFVVNAYHTQT